MCTAVYNMYMYCTICCIESSDIMTGTVHVQDSGSCGIWNLSAIGRVSSREKIQGGKMYCMKTHKYS